MVANTSSMGYIIGEKTMTDTFVESYRGYEIWFHPSGPPGSVKEYYYVLGYSNNFGTVAEAEAFIDPLAHPAYEVESYRGYEIWFSALPPGVAIGYWYVKNDPANNEFAGLAAAETYVDTLTPVTITINMVAGSGGSVNPNGAVTVTLGQPYTFTATPDPTYFLSYWLIGTSGKFTTNPFQTTFPDTSWNGVTIQAVFGQAQPEQIQLTLAVQGSGDTTPGPGLQTLNVGDTASFTATPHGGYVFSYWIIGTTFVINNPLSFTVASSQAGTTITAVFKQQTVYGGGGGGVDVATIAMAIGTILVVGIGGYLLLRHRRKSRTA